MVLKQKQQGASYWKFSSQCAGLWAPEHRSSLDSNGPHMAAAGAKASAESRVTVFSDYKPAAGNHRKFAEQEKNRKTLRRGKKQGDKSKPASIWDQLNFANKDQNVKFRQWRGINSEDGCSSVDKVTRLWTTGRSIWKPRSSAWSGEITNPHTKGNGVRFMASVQERKQLEKSHTFKVWGFTDFLF